MSARIGSSAILIATLALAGCSEDRMPQDAMKTFREFQDALHRADKSACRELLTVESAAALSEMPWDHIQEQSPLQVLGAHREQNAIHVEVVNPNEGDARGEFVVVREYGRLVVDLVATAGLTAETVEATGSPEQFVPRELSPEDMERIREYELSQPPR